ncbi:MAG TPA: hypothetical protein VMW31_04410 [Devosiaceae bacterium]|nr:hypothetical protein [Devosiaceae bacterium]
MRPALLGFSLVLLAAGPGLAQVTGRASALGSDQLSVNGQVFQLYGIDGVEFHQFCFVEGRPWACGASATRAMQTLLDPVIVECTPAGPPEGGAVYATCTSGEGDIAEIITRQGWAVANLAQTDAYAAAEEAARAAGEGVWVGNFVAPGEYRADIAAIERRYAELVPEVVRAEAERTLTVAGGGIEVFRSFHVFTGAEGGGLVDREKRVDQLPPGFIPAAVVAPNVFGWDTVSHVLEAWQHAAATAISRDAVEAVWAQLQTRPSEIVETPDATIYLRVMREGAAEWIAQGRQPVLLVTAPTLPSWVGEWLGDNPPVGAEVTRKTDESARSYLATLDGIDIHVGAAPPAESLLFPQDLLVEVDYGEAGSGTILSIDRDESTLPGEMVARYAMGVEWKEDTLIWLRFPASEAEAFYEHS